VQKKNCLIFEIGVNHNLPLNTTLQHIKKIRTYACGLIIVCFAILVGCDSTQEKSKVGGYILRQNYVMATCYDPQEGVFTMDADRKTGMENNPMFNDFEPKPRVFQDARAEFEFFTLTHLVYGMEDVVISYLQEENEAAMFELALIALFLASSRNLEDEVGVDVHPENLSFDIDILTTHVNRLRAYYDEVRYKWGLGDGHILNVMFVEIGTTEGAFVIELYDTNIPRIGSYIGIAYDESVGLRVFNLSKVNANAHMFTSFINEMRVDNDAVDIIENTKEAFVSAMERVMKKNSQ